MSRIARLSAVLAVFSLTGCATVSVSRDKAAAVKTVAIIGFSGVTDLTERDSGGKTKGGGIAGMVKAVEGASDTFSGDLDRRRMEQAEQAYTLLEQELQKTTGWKVAQRATVAADPDYGNALKENPNTDSVRLVGMQRLPDVLRPEVAETLSAKQRADLCQRLGVDAVAIAKVRYVIGDKGGVSIGGFGNKVIYPKAIVELKVLDGSEVPVWSDRWAEGKPTKEGIDEVMGSKDNTKESGILIDAAKSGFDTLGERYKQQP
ncbi:MAG: hypothetical protein IPJ65_30480 [Archangiaceae bacterium]|nr:hypothetical protein [Archangiaceae bacterium]